MAKSDRLQTSKRRKRRSIDQEINGPVPAIGYLRCSDDSQDASIADQKQMIIAEIEGKFEIAEWYEDDGVSGWKTAADRKGFDSTMQRVMYGDGPKVIVCWKQNRFARFTGSKFVRHLDEMNDVGACLYTLDEGYMDPNNLSDVLKGLLQGEQDFQYSETPSADSYRGLIILARQGYWVSIVPLGYKLDGPYVGSEKGFKLIEHPEEAKIVRYIFRLFVQDLLTTVDIAKRLNSESVPTHSVLRNVRKKKGYKHLPKEERPYRCEIWSAEVVNAILTNRTYIGCYSWGETCQSEFHANREIVTIEDNPNQDKLIDRDTFLRAQHLIAERATNRGAHRAKDVRNVLGGGKVLRCGYCGEPMSKTGRTNDSDCFFDCQREHDEGQGNRVQQDHVLAMIVPAIVNHFQGPETTEGIYQSILESMQPKDNLSAGALADAIKRKRQEISDAKRNLALVDPEFVGTVQDSIRTIQSEISRMERELAAAGTPLADFEKQARTLANEAMKAYDEIAVAWREGDFEMLRRILNTVCKSITVWSEPKRAVLFDLWESLPDEFTIRDLTGDAHEKKVINSQLGRLAGQGSIEMVSKKRGPISARYRRTAKPPKNTGNGYKLTHGRIVIGNHSQPHVNEVGGT